MSKTGTDPYYSKSRPELAEQIATDPGNVVLDVGCGTGQLSSLIRRERRAGQIWGVEVVEKVAKQARANPDLDRVMSGDISAIAAELPAGHFSHIVAGDVLEHLVDPWSTLATLRRSLRTDGRIVASMPNIRNLSFIAQLLLGGSFRYRDSGVMDRTHLRFFARKDIRALFAEAGFRNIKIRQARPKRSPLSRLAKLVFGDLAIKVFVVTADNGG